jgi:TolB protein
VWSPDGQRLAFLSDRAGQADIYLADADNAKGRRLTNTPTEARVLAWSPDGAQILYIAVNSNVSNSLSFDIHVMNSDGSEQRLLAEGVNLRTGLADCHYPVWSPDGRHVAFMDNDTIFVIDADGTNPRKLLTWPGGHVEFDW